MVRKWSCLINFILTNNLFKKNTSTFLFLIIKKSLICKKFFKYKTKIKRSWFKILKKKGNLYIYNQIFKYWITFFFIIKKLYKFQYYHLFFKYTMLIYNFNNFKNKKLAHLNNFYLWNFLNKNNFYLFVKIKNIFYSFMYFFNFLENNKQGNVYSKNTICFFKPANLNNTIHLNLENLFYDYIVFNFNLIKKHYSSFYFIITTLWINKLIKR